jgi:hypothetical protein
MFAFSPKILIYLLDFTLCILFRYEACNLFATPKATFLQTDEKFAMHFAKSALESTEAGGYSGDGDMEGTAEGPSESTPGAPSTMEEQTTHTTIIAQA